MRPAPWLSIACAAALASLGTTGCETFGPATCDRSPEGNPLLPYTQGKVTDGVYMTSDWNGELLFFPGGMRYELKHGLGVKPRWVNSYLSFDEHGTLEGGVLAQSAGNQVEILGVDETSIRVANDSCVEYWLLVSAGTGAQP